MLVKGVAVLMVGVLLIIKPDALKRPFGQKNILNPEAAPTKSYLRLMRGIGIFAIVAGVSGILAVLKIFDVYKIFN
jgi:hypothetical protein